MYVLYIYIYPEHHVRSSIYTGLVRLDLWCVLWLAQVAVDAGDVGLIPTGQGTWGT